MQPIGGPIGCSADSFYTWQGAPQGTQPPSHICLAHLLPMLASEAVLRATTELSPPMGTVVDRGLFLMLSGGSSDTSGGIRWAAGGEASHLLGVEGERQRRRRGGRSVGV